MQQVYYEFMLVHTNTIDVIYSGKYRHPAELLMVVDEGLLEEFQKYDYVIVVQHL